MVLYTCTENILDILVRANLPSSHPQGRVRQVGFKKFGRRYNCNLCTLSELGRCDILILRPSDQRVSEYACAEGGPRFPIVNALRFHRVAVAYFSTIVFGLLLGFPIARRLKLLFSFVHFSILKYCTTHSNVQSSVGGLKVSIFED